MTPVDPTTGGGSLATPTTITATVTTATILLQLLLLLLLLPLSLLLLLLAFVGLYDEVWSVDGKIIHKTTSNINSSPSTH